ncbi:hypothetical protein CHUAL_008865 [Chamberlinius hualienensis]
MEMSGHDEICLLKTTKFNDNSLGLQNSQPEIVQWKNEFNKDPNKYHWKIIGVQAIIKNGAIEICSPNLNIYDNKLMAKVKLQVATNDDVYMSLMFLHPGNKEVKLPKTSIPKVTYTLKNFTSSEKDVVREIWYNFNEVLHYNCYQFKMRLCHKSLFLDARFNTGDSIVLQISTESTAQTRLAKSYNGNLSDEIHNFSTKKTSCILSPYFYTSLRGYRVLIQLFFNVLENNNGRGLIARICFMTGDFDSTLGRNFCHKTTITVFNQEKPTAHKRKSIVMDLKRCLWYELHVLGSDEIMNGGFCKNDSIFYNVSIKKV